MMIHDKRFTAGLIPSLSGLELQHIHTAKKKDNNRDTFVPLREGNDE